MNERSASAATERSASRWSAIQPWRARSDGRCADSAGQAGAELRLTARTPDEQHQLAGHRQRNGWAEILLDQREGQVDPGGHPGRGVDVAVPDEDRVGLDLDRGIAAAQRGAGRPVRGRAAAVEQPGPGEQKRPGAHRSDPPRAPRRQPQPRDQALVLGGGSHTPPAGHQQRVDRTPAGLGRHVRRELEPARGAERRVRCAHEFDPIGARLSAFGEREHLGGPGDVELWTSGKATITTRRDGDMAPSWRRQRLAAMTMTRRFRPDQVGARREQTSKRGYQLVAAPSPAGLCWCLPYAGIAAQRGSARGNVELKSPPGGQSATRQTRGAQPNRTQPEPHPARTAPNAPTAPPPPTALTTDPPTPTYRPARSPNPRSTSSAFSPIVPRAGRTPS